MVVDVPFHANYNVGDVIKAVILAVQLNAILTVEDHVLDYALTRVTQLVLDQIQQTAQNAQTLVTMRVSSPAIIIAILLVEM